MAIEYHTRRGRLLGSPGGRRAAASCALTQRKAFRTGPIPQAGGGSVV